MKRGLTMVVLASLWLAKCAAAYPATLTVLNFQNRNPGDGYDWLGKAFPDMLLTHFAQHGKFAALEREKMQSLSDELRLQHKAAVNQSAVTEFAGIAKVVKVVYGHYAVERGQLAVTAFILDAETKRVDSVATVTGQLEELCELDKRLFAALLDRLGRPLSNAELAALPCVISGNLSATTQFYRGLEAFDAGDYPLALIEFREAIRQDATYGEARLWVGKIYRALGEFQHAVVTLKKFTQELPRHPAALEAHRLTGLILLQDLKKALLAVPEFEKLAGSEPEGSQPTARLREAHWNEYVLFAKKTNPPFWYTKEQQDADQKEFERLGKLAAERTQRFKLCVEGWRRLGECWQQLGDWRKAFAAHDQARAISRWVLLDTNEPFEINYAAYRAYEKLLAVDDSEVPVPDWVVRANAQPMPLLDGLDPDRVYRYTLIHPRWLLGDFVLLAPEGLQFTNVVAQAHSLSTDFPARFRLCIKNFQTLANWGGSADFFEQPIHCFPYYLGYDFMTNAFTKSFAIPDNHRAIIVRMLGLNWKGRFDSLVVEPSFAPWKKSVADTAPSRPTHCQFAYWPVDARLLVDGKEISPSPEAGLCDLALDPGKHRAELRKDGWEPVDLEVDLPAKSERSFFVSLDSAWKDLGIRLPGCLKPHLSQAANGEFWLVYEIPTGVDSGGMKAEESWRFEITFSSGAFSSTASI